MAYTFCPTCKLRESPSTARNQVRRLDLNDGEIVRRVRADDGRFVLLAIVHGDFDLARLGDHVVVGQDVALFIDHESRSLPFLRNQAVEKVQGHGARGDVDDRRNVLVVDGNIVLLFAIERRLRRRLGDLHLRGMTEPGRGMQLRPACEFERQVVK